MANLDAARERILGGGNARGVPPAIHASWLRARNAGMRPDATPPPVPLADDVRRLRREHPLAAVWPVLRETLRWATAETGRLLIVSDAQGHLLWCQGDKTALRLAERVNMTPGSLWSEDTVGTSAVGTALTLRRPFAVFGAEHYLSFARGFACSAAPIHDPVSGRVLGTVDLTSAVSDDRALKVSLVTTAAKLAESHLLTERLRHHARLREKYADRLTRRVGAQGAIVTGDGTVLHEGPDGWLPTRLAGTFAEGPVILPDGRHATVESLESDRYFLVLAQDRAGADTVLRYNGLGRARALLRIGDMEHELTRRHSEIVALLLAHGAGLTAEELAAEIYGADGRAGTIRSELSRLRPILGHRLGSEPYRLLGDHEADFQAPGACTERLLPRSSAPGIAALRGPASRSR